MLLDDPIGSRQAKACSLMLGLGCEERLEETTQGLLVHAQSVIMNRNDDIGATGLGNLFGRRSRRSEEPVLLHRKMRFPPLGMASRAFTAKLMRTCSIWPASALTGAVSGIELPRDADILAQQALQQAPKIPQ